VQQDQMIREAAGRLNLSEDALRSDLQKRQRRTRPERAEEKAPETAPVPRPQVEVELARALAHHPECAELVRRYLPLQQLADADCRTIVGILLRGESLLSDLSDRSDASDETRRLAAEILAAQPKEASGEKPAEESVKDYLLQIWLRTLKEQRRALDERRNTAAGPEREHMDAEYADLVVHIQRIGKAIPGGWDQASAIIELHAGAVAPAPHVP
jgi:DNA primase